MGVSLASLQHGYTATFKAGGGNLSSWTLAPFLYLQTVALLLIDVLQLLSFGFGADAPPSIASQVAEAPWSVAEWL